MKFLADENVPQELIDILKAYEFDVESIRPNHSGVSDEEVVALSNVMRRTIITFDKGFGKLIFQKQIIPEFGLVFIRDNPVVSEEVAELLNYLFSQAVAEEFDYSLFVIEKGFIKKRKLK